MRIEVSAVDGGGSLTDPRIKIFGDESRIEALNHGSQQFLVARQMGERQSAIPGARSRIDDALQSARSTRFTTASGNNLIPFL